MSLRRRPSEPLSRRVPRLLDPVAIDEAQTQIILRYWVTLLCREAIPISSFLVIVPTANALVVHVPEITLSCRMAINSRAQEPATGFSPVLSYAYSIAVAEAQVVLSTIVPLLGGASVPPNGSATVPAHAQPVVVTN